MLSASSPCANQNSGTGFLLINKLERPALLDRPRRRLMDALSDVLGFGRLSGAIFAPSQWRNRRGAS